MAILSDTLRVRAKELDAWLEPFLATHHEIDRHLVSCVKAAVVPELMTAIADMLDAVEARAPDPKSERLRRLIQQNAELRKAVTAGNRDAIDRILDRIIDGPPDA